MAGCSHAPGPAARLLPEKPARLMRAVAVPHLTSQCYFPWFGVRGCKGEDALAMLQLTNSALKQANARLVASGGWYDGVGKSYAAGR